MDILLYLLIYLPLCSHGLIPSFSPPIWCFRSSFSAQIAQFRVLGREQPKIGSRRRTCSGTTAPSGTTSITTAKKGFGSATAVVTAVLPPLPAVLLGREIQKTVLAITFDSGLRFECSLALFEATNVIYNTNTEDPSYIEAKNREKARKFHNKVGDRRD